MTYGNRLGGFFMLRVTLTLNPFDQGNAAGAYAVFLPAYWLVSVCLDLVVIAYNAAFHRLFHNDSCCTITAVPVIAQVPIKRQWQPYIAKYP